MICYHILPPATYPIPCGEQGHETIACIVQSLFPFYGKQDLSVGQTAFEHLIWLNQTSLHHVAMTQPSGAEKREQSPTSGTHPEEWIAILATPAHVSAQRCVTLGMKIVPRWERGRELTHCSWWVCKDLKWAKQTLLAKRMWFLGNSGTHCSKTRLLVPGSDSRQVKHTLPLCRERNLVPDNMNGGFITTIISMACSRYCSCFDW